MVGGYAGTKVTNGLLVVLPGSDQTQGGVAGGVRVGVESASVQTILVAMPGASESAAHPQVLWGSDRAATLTEITAGLWHFAILAGQTQAPDSNHFTWSEPSNWAAIEIS